MVWLDVVVCVKCQVFDVECWDCEVQPLLGGCATPCPQPSTLCTTLTVVEGALLWAEAFGNMEASYRWALYGFCRLFGIFGVTSADSHHRDK